MTSPRLRPRSIALAFATLALAPLGAAQCPVMFELEPGPGGSSLSTARKAFGRELYFENITTAEGLELWKWDPVNGAGIVADIRAGAGHSRPYAMTPCCTAQGLRVFFSAAGTGINTELWITDGTAAGTMQVTEIRPGSSASLPADIVAVGNRVFFVANDGTTGRELWVSDGTAAGTNLVLDIRPGTNSNPQEMVALGHKLVFSADDGSNGRELWVSDGTSAGTMMLADMLPGPSGSHPFALTRCGDHVFFAGTDDTAGTELWKTDGTPGGTTIVADIAAGLRGSNPRDLSCCGDRLFFAASLPGTGNLLHVSDGTAAGTYRVQSDISNAVQVAPRSAPDVALVCNGDRVFFAGYYGVQGTELWVSDGTDAGTYLVHDIYPGGAGSSPNNVTAIGNGVVFGADDGATGRELWFSDGTAAGTSLVCDIDPTGNGSVDDLFVVGGQLILTAVHPTLGREPHVLATPGAHVESLDGSGAPGFPTLRVRNGVTPILGTQIELVADDGPAGHVGALFVNVSGPPSPPVPPFMMGGCDWIGLLTGTALPIVAGAAPSLSVPLGIPALPAYEGAQLHFQVVWIDFGSAPPIQLSNGLQLVLGEAAPH